MVFFEEAPAVRELQRRFKLSEYTNEDINEHASTLRHLAAQGCSVVEMGVRTGVSSWPLLLGLHESSPWGECAFGQGRKFHSGFDVNAFMEAPLARQLAEEIGVEYSFTQASVLRIDLEEDCDLLFIDTYHSFAQLRWELRRHGPRARKYIVLHDTVLNGEEAECLVGRSCLRLMPRVGRPNMTDMQAGLLQAIEEFLSLHGEWRVAHHYSYNNGLTVLARVPPTAEHCQGEALEWLAMSPARRPYTAWEHARVGLLIEAFPLGFAATSSPLSSEEHLRKALGADYGQPHALLALAQRHCPRWAQSQCPEADRKEALLLLSKLLKYNKDIWPGQMMMAELQTDPGPGVSPGDLHVAAWRLAPKNRQAAALAARALRRVGREAEAESILGSASRSLQTSTEAAQPAEDAFPLSEIYWKEVLCRANRSNWLLDNSRRARRA
eukprot:CAMPEP_0170627062 /NCGR_PEP_ID=MMETSP0224-20130122/31737_1 /TAXON_ID=285029 /ORGANISM="Togula jolla, Strain CCCM 725" /LENGTH=438 /DNA_ID=CAMNT_0010953969 /DNA_START=73 /DNA_END=1390 /DNA_ORIENTATION=+